MYLDHFKNKLNLDIEICQVLTGLRLVPGLSTVCKNCGERLKLLRFAAGLNQEDVEMLPIATMSHYENNLTSPDKNKLQGLVKFYSRRLKRKIDISLVICGKTAEQVGKESSQINLIGRRIKLFRESAGLRQSALKRRARTFNLDFRKTENGESVPSLVYIRRLKRAFAEFYGKGTADLLLRHNEYLMPSGEIIVRGSLKYKIFALMNKALKHMSENRYDKASTVLSRILELKLSPQETSEVESLLIRCNRKDGSEIKQRGVSSKSVAGHPAEFRPGVPPTTPDGKNLIAGEIGPGGRGQMPMPEAAQRKLVVGEVLRNLALGTYVWHAKYEFGVVIEVKNLRGNEPRVRVNFFNKYGERHEVEFGPINFAPPGELYLASSEDVAAFDARTQAKSSAAKEILPLREHNAEEIRKLFAARSSPFTGLFISSSNYEALRCATNPNGPQLMAPHKIRSIVSHLWGAKAQRDKGIITLDTATRIERVALYYFLRVFDSNMVESAPDSIRFELKRQGPKALEVIKLKCRNGKISKHAEDVMVGEILSGRSGYIRRWFQNLREAQSKEDARKEAQIRLREAIHVVELILSQELPEAGINPRLKSPNTAQSTQPPTGPAFGSPMPNIPYIVGEILKEHPNLTLEQLIGVVSQRIGNLADLYPGLDAEIEQCFRDASAAAEPLLFWGTNVPVRDIAYSYEALARHREHAEEAGNYKGPLVRIYRAVAQNVFERIKAHGFEEVPDDAVLGKIERSIFSFHDDYAIHRGRLACSGAFKESSLVRNYQGRGTMVAIDVPADLLLNEDVLILDKDVAIYTDRLTIEEGGITHKQLGALLDRNSAATRKLMGIVTEVSDANKVQLRRILKESPLEAQSFIYNKREIIIPARLLNLFLKDSKEMPIHTDHDYFDVNVRDVMNPVYLPSFWKKCHEYFGRLITPSAEDQLIGIWQDDSSGFRVMLSIMPGRSIEFAVFDDRLMMQNNNILNIVCHNPEVSPTLQSYVDMRFDRYGSLEAYSGVLEQFLQTSSPEVIGPLWETIEAVSRLLKMDIQGPTATGGVINRELGGEGEASREHRTPEGSPAKCVEAIIKYCGNDFNKTFYANDLIKAGLRKHKDGKDYALFTVRLELRLLQQCEVLDIIKDGGKNRYILRENIRNLSPPQIIEFLQKIKDIEELNHYNIPKDTKPVIRSRVDTMIIAASQSADASGSPDGVAPKAPAPTKEIALKDYLADIQSAEEQGAIVIGKILGTEFSNSHLDSLGDSNTRHLESNGKRLFEAILKLNKGKEVPVLELGPGAAVACGDMSKIAEESGMKAAIDTIGIVPVAPHFRLLANVSEISAWAKKHCEKNGKDEEIKILLKEYDPQKSDPRLSLKLAFALQARGYPVFEILQKPFIRRQYIGNFIHKSIAPDGKYAFIYDYIGAFFYATSKRYLSPESEPLLVERAAFEKALNMLSRDGIFYIAHRPEPKRDAALFKNSEALQDFILIRWMDKDNAFVVRKDSIIAKKFREDGRVSVESGGFLYSVKDFDTVSYILNEIKPAPAARPAVSQTAQDSEVALSLLAHNSHSPYSALSPLNENTAWPVVKNCIQNCAVEKILNGKRGGSLRGSCIDWKNGILSDLCALGCVEKIAVKSYYIPASQQYGNQTLSHYWIEIKLQNDDRWYVLDRTIGQFADMKVLKLVGGLKVLRSVMGESLISKNGIKTDEDLLGWLCQFDENKGFYGPKEEYPFIGQREEVLSSLYHKILAASKKKAANPELLPDENEPIHFLRRIINPKELTQNMIEEILSAMFSNKKLTLAFCKQLKGMESAQLRMLVKELIAWKNATGEKSKTMKTLLDNFTIIEYEDQRDLGSQLKDRRIDVNDSSSLIFIYGPKPKDVSESIVSGSAVKPVYIIEQEGGFPVRYYYPLLEMVTISLAKEILHWNEKELHEVLADSNINAETFGIEAVLDKDLGILIFKVLPKMEQYDNNDRINRYTRLLQLLHSA